MIDRYVESLTVSELRDLIRAVVREVVREEAGFPTRQHRSTCVAGDGGWCTCGQNP